MLQLKISKTAGTVLKILLSAAALLFVFSKIDITQVLNITKNADFLLLFFALILFISSKLTAALRLNKFFRQIGIFMSELYNLKLYLLGMFYNIFLPGGIGGDGYKIYLLNRIFKIQTRKIFWSVLTDRLSGVLALLALAMLLAGFIKLPLSFNHRYLSWLLIPLSIVSFFLFIKLFIPYLKKIFLQINLLSFLVQIFQILCALVILKAIGEQEKEMEYLFLFLISSIVAMLPITIGGAGSREITFLFGSGLLGLNENTSITLSLVFYFITLFTSFWGIIYSVRHDYFERIT
jgi:uncharacterized membrane protein YbhN (UPF0104 family)